MAKSAPACWFPVTEITELLGLSGVSLYVSVNQSRVSLLNYNHAWGDVIGRADIRTVPEDFVVEERFEQPLSGDGDHIYLQIRKRGQNTRWIASNLAQIFKVEDSDVGYCGLKDRRALTTQWFSVRQPSSNFDCLAGSLRSDPSVLAGCEVLQHRRHRRKLRRGIHSSNVFQIRLCNFRGDIKAVEQRLKLIATQGVPNYFGEQRFGTDGANLAEADRILNQSISSRPNKHRDSQWGLYISAARSHLFNCVLSARIKHGDWRTSEPEGTSPTGPLWGRGRSRVDPALARFEAEVLAPYQQWCHGLEHCGLQQDRRALLLLPEAMQWQWQDGVLQMQFELPPGAYATSVLRELTTTQVPKSSLANTPPSGAML